MNKTSKVFAASAVIGFIAAGLDDHYNITFKLKRSLRTIRAQRLLKRISSLNDEITDAQRGSGRASRYVLGIAPKDVERLKKQRDRLISLGVRRGELFGYRRA